MDIIKLYNSALANASLGKHDAAQKELLKILAEKADHIDALLLLGKVEYYLKKYSSSRKRFETVLTYKPDNKTAYWGIKYYKERKLKYIITTFFIVIVSLIISNTIILYCMLDLSFATKISVSEEKISKKLEFIDRNVRQDFNKNTRTIKKQLESVNQELYRLKKAINK